MVIRTIRATTEEADQILNHNIHHVFRSSSDNLKEGDIVQFLVYRNGKPAFHKVNMKSYVITIVQDRLLAPLENGWCAIGFKEIA